eukprot:766279-Hanusia_phi.AAC.2
MNSETKSSRHRLLVVSAITHGDCSVWKQSNRWYFNAVWSSIASRNMSNVFFTLVLSSESISPLSSCYHSLQRMVGLNLHMFNLTEGFGRGFIPPWYLKHFIGLHPTDRRYVMIHNYLSTLQASDFTHVLYADCSDVYFFKSPLPLLASMSSSWLFVQREWRRNQQSKYMIDRFQKCGIDWEKFSNSWILNSGLFGGSLENVKIVFAAMTKGNFTMRFYFDVSTVYKNGDHQSTRSVVVNGSQCHDSIRSDRSCVCRHKSTLVDDNGDIPFYLDSVQSERLVQQLEHLKEFCSGKCCGLALSHKAKITMV